MKERESEKRWIIKNKKWMVCIQYDGITFCCVLACIKEYTKYKKRFVFGGIFIFTYVHVVSFIIKINLRLLKWTVTQVIH